MITTVSTIWKGFSDELRAAPSDLSKLAFYRLLRDWCEQHSREIGIDVLARYGIDSLLRLPIDEYPVERADVVVSDEIRSLLQQHPSSRDTIGMFIRDQLWSIVAFKTTKDCPNCASDELRALVDVASEGAVVLACDACGWAEDEWGAAWQGRPTCRPATTAELRDHGFL